MNLGNLRIMHEALLLVRVVNCVYTFRHTGDKLSVDMKTADATKAFVWYIQPIPEECLHVDDKTELQYCIVNRFTDKKDTDSKLRDR